MRFLGVTALRYIKSEEITPVELMTANEWGIQAQHSATSGPWRTANTSAFLLTKRRNRHAHLTLPYVSCKGIP